jgi:type IV secretory pathway VirJ component
VAADLSALGYFLADRYQQPRERLPIILGVEQDAALAYAALAQAADDDFHTAVSVDFCPQLALPKPLCPQRQDNLAIADDTTSGAAGLLPAPYLVDNWFVFQNPARQSCDAAATAALIDKVPDARLTALSGPVIEHGKLSEPIAALLRWLDPRIAQQVKPSATLAEVPLIEAAVDSDSRFLAVMLSGDGGWAKLDRSLAAELNPTSATRRKKRANLLIGCSPSQKVGTTRDFLPIRQKV